MGLSNQEGHLTLATGNKSELADGLLHDLRRQRRRLRAAQGRARRRWCGQLATWRNAEAERMRRDAADPAELHHQAALCRAAPGQVDQDSLPPYDALDAILELYV